MDPAPKYGDRLNVFGIFQWPKNKLGDLIILSERTWRNIM